MLKINFDYKTTILSVQCNSNEQMEEVFTRFKTKAQINETLIFLFGGNNINGSISVSKFVGDNYNPNNPPLIVVQSIDVQNKKDSLFKSKYIICPLCKQSSIIKMEDFKINLSDCKEGHKVDKITLDKFEEGQKIDYEKIECQTCKEKKRSETNKNTFFTCLSCHQDICPLCKPKHAQHNVIDYDKKVYYCLKHGENFTKYCHSCNINICIQCESEHRSHNTESFGEMIPQMDNVRAKMDSLRQAIDAYKISVSKIIDRLQKVTNNIEEYYNINNSIIQNYEHNFRNYEILNNVNGINDNMKNTLYKICNNLDIMSQTQDVFDLYNKMTFKSLDQIKITYDLEQRDRKLEGEDTVNIFGREFVEKNKDKCRLIINNQNYELQEKFNIRNYDKNQLEVVINGLSSLDNLSYMFSNCSSLVSVPDIANINTIDITDMRGIFDGCSSLISLPDISNWNLINVTNISRMFDGCCSLTSLPDISKWDISNVTDISNIFRGCNSLTSLPDI